MEPDDLPAIRSQSPRLYPSLPGKEVGSEKEDPENQPPSSSDSDDTSCISVPLSSFPNLDEKIGKAVTVAMEAATKLRDASSSSAAEESEESRDHFFRELKSVIPAVGKAQATALAELKYFQDEQWLIPFGVEPTRKLANLSSWFDKITKCLHTLRQSLQAYHDQCQTDPVGHCEDLTILIEKISNWHRDMIFASVTSENEPFPIVRSWENPQDIFRFFMLNCGSPTLPPTSRNDDQLKFLTPDKLQSVDDIMQAVNNPQFHTLVESNDKRDENEKKGSSSDFYEGTSFTFRLIKDNPDPEDFETQSYMFTEFKCQVDDGYYLLSVLSMPYLKVTTPAEEAKAWATLLWESGLPSWKRNKLALSRDPAPPKVSWARLIHLIDLLFLQRGNPLSEESKTYLKTRLFRGKESPSDANEMVSYSLFCKDPLFSIQEEEKVPRKRQGKKQGQAKTKVFTFWDWLWSYLQLLEWTPGNFEVANLWKEGKIQGFLSKTQILEKLRRRLSQSISSPDTIRRRPFIVAFPEEMEASLGIYFLDGTKHLIEFVYSAGDLERQSLSQRILSSVHITHLYPNVPKGVAFQVDAKTQIANSMKMKRKFSFLDFVINFS